MLELLETAMVKRERDRMKEYLLDILILARRLRDESFESREEFREDLNNLCDKILQLKTEL